MNTFDVSAEEIAKKYRQAGYFSDITADVEDMIVEEAAEIEVDLVMLGFDQAEIDSISDERHPRLYYACRRIIKWRTSAELAEEFSHEASNIAMIRWKKADNLIERIRNKSEAFVDLDKYKLENIRGTWDFQRDGNYERARLQDWDAGVGE